MERNHPRMIATNTRMGDGEFKVHGSLPGPIENFFLHFHGEP